MKKQPLQTSSRKSRPIAVMVFLTFFLCVALTFSGCAGSFLSLAREIASATQTDTEKSTGKQETTNASNAPDATGQDLHREDAQALLHRSEESTPIDDAFLSIAEVVKKVQNTVVEIYTSGGSAGSGTIISEDGYILTCNHVVSGASSVIAQTITGKKYNASLVGTDSSTDLAILKITPDEGETLPFAVQGHSDALVVGEYVIAIGNPLGTLGGTVTHGIVSATARQVSFSNSDGTISVMTLIQTDAAINAGNSGGALFNMNGELVGVVNAKYSASGVEGLGFAIPIDLAYEVELDLISYGYVRGRVDHGLSFVDVTSSNYNYYYFRFSIPETGLYVVSSKYNDDLKNKDRIVSVNGKDVNTEAEFKQVISGCAIGDTITVKYVRYNTSGRTVTSETKETTITLREYVPDNVLIS